MESLPCQITGSPTWTGKSFRSSGLTAFLRITTLYNQCEIVDVLQAVMIAVSFLQSGSGEPKGSAPLSLEIILWRPSSQSKIPDDPMWRLAICRPGCRNLSRRSQERPRRRDGDEVVRQYPAPPGQEDADRPVWRMTSSNSAGVGPSASTISERSDSSGGSIERPASPSGSSATGAA
jgi:hypothetical protein